MSGPRHLDDELGTPRDASAAEQAENGFRRGEPAAVRRVAERVHRIVGFRGYRIPAEDRRDLEQQVMAQLWQRIGGTAPAPVADFWGLVEVVSARRCIDWLRTRKADLALEVDPVDLLQNPHRDVADSERRRLAAAALETLPGPCRRLIYLHAGREMTYGEISTLLGKSEGALRVQMHRCLERARRALAELTATPAAEGTSS